MVLEEGDKTSELLPKIKQFVMNNLEKQQAPVVQAAPVAPAVPMQQAVIAPASATSKPLSAPVAKLNQQIAAAAKAAGVEVTF